MSGGPLDEMPLRQRIRWLRENGSHGKLSHDRLAAALGTTRQTVINWEKGTRPTDRYAAALAEFFGVPVETFRAPAAEAVTLHRLADRLEELEAGLEALRPLLPRIGDLQEQLDGLTQRVGALERQARRGKQTGGQG